MTLDASDLAARFLSDLRTPIGPDGDGEATDLLRFGAEELDDDTLWSATLLIVAGASDDGERWMIGDGLIDESIATRPELRLRWHEARATNAEVAAVFRVMIQASEDEGWDLGWWDRYDQLS